MADEAIDLQLLHDATEDALSLIRWISLTPPENYEKQDLNELQRQATELLPDLEAAFFSVCAAMVDRAEARVDENHDTSR